MDEQHLAFPRLPCASDWSTTNPTPGEGPDAMEFSDLSCLIAKQIPIKEAKKIPGAKAALDKEWANIWAI